MRCTCIPSVARPTGHPHRPDTYRMVADAWRDGATVHRYCGYCGLIVSSRWVPAGVTYYFTSREGF